MFRLNLVALLVAGAASGQSNEIVSSTHEVDSLSRRRTSITMQPLPLIFESATLGVERALSDKVSMLVSTTVTIRSESQKTEHIDLFDRQVDAISGSLEPGLNYFFAGTAPEGFWIGPRVSFAYSRTKVNSKQVLTDGSTVLISETFRSRTVGGALLLGYNAIFANGFTVQVGLGGSATYGWGNQSSELSTRRTGSVFFDGVNGSANQLQVGARGLLALGWSL
jgi:hypothetical protein